MHKRISYRKLLSLLLILVFISPLLVKWAHVLCVHHHHCHISSSDKPVFSAKHKKCTICSFEFVEFFADITPIVVGETNLFSVYNAACTKSIYKTTSSFLFYLRAPPVYSEPGFDEKSMSNSV